MEVAKESEIKAEEDQRTHEVIFIPETTPPTRAHNAVNPPLILIKVMSELDDLAAAAGAKDVKLMTWSMESNTQAEQEATHLLILSCQSPIPKLQP